MTIERGCGDEKDLAPGEGGEAGDHHGPTDEGGEADSHHGPTDEGAEASSHYGPTDEGSEASSHHGPTDEGGEADSHHGPTHEGGDRARGLGAFGVLPGLLAEPAVTSPAKLAARRPSLLTRDRLDGLAPAYDVIVIGSGLAGLTAANVLAKAGHSVVLFEQHYNFGGLATWFKRQNGHIFDISLHGFPVGMKKTCRKYWTKGIADSIVKLRTIRFDNPEFALETTFDKEDFTRILIEKFGVAPNTVDEFFTTIRAMNFYDDQGLTTRALFERFFPGRTDVVRFLMEPIAYANGSTLDDPAITYGIVFSNFMSQGVYTFQGGTDRLIRAMKAELLANGVDVRNYAEVERIVVESARNGSCARGSECASAMSGKSAAEGGRAGQAVTAGDRRRPRAVGVIVNGVAVSARAVVSNANLKTTITKLVGEASFRPEFLDEARGVRMNTSSSQVYLGIRKGESVPYLGDLFFTSSAPRFDSEALCALDCTSRTFSFYYPETRPGSNRYTIVASMNSRYEDWASMDDATYLASKERYARETIAALEAYVPDIRQKIDHVEVATPRTFEFFTRHEAATSFGTKFEGLRVSQALPKELPGLFHAGSVGIIMSGWLGAANYGVIVANEVDRSLRGGEAPAIASRRDPREIAARTSLARAGDTIEEESAHA